jgi:hypothetical protein
MQGGLTRVRVPFVCGGVRVRVRVRVGVRVRVCMCAGVVVRMYGCGAFVRVPMCLAGGCWAHVQFPPSPSRHCVLKRGRRALAHPPVHVLFAHPCWHVGWVAHATPGPYLCGAPSG